MSGTGWLLDEDRALKLKFQGLTVADTNNPTRPVQVVYRTPENEMADQLIPQISIWHTSIEKDATREHRGRTALQYTPPGQSRPWPDPGNVLDSPYVVDFPIPYSINYEIRVLTRVPDHRMSLLAALAAPERIPARFGFLAIPTDGTVRRLDLEGGPEIEDVRDNDGKILFRTTYRISISSEYPPSIGDAAAKVVANGVNLSLVYMQPQYS